MNKKNLWVYVKGTNELVFNFSFLTRKQALTALKQYGINYPERYDIRGEQIMSIINYNPSDMQYINSFNTYSMGSKETYALYYNDSINDFVIKMYIDNKYLDDMGDMVGESLINNMDSFDFSKDLFNSIKLFKKSLKTRVITKTKVNNSLNNDFNIELSGSNASKTFSIDIALLSYLKANKALNMSKFVQDAIIEKLQRENN